jgi:hypothetical protein
MFLRSLIFLGFSSLISFSALSKNVDTFDCIKPKTIDSINSDYPSAIDINFENYRKWSKNYLNLLKAPYKDIPKEFKQKFKVNLFVSFKSGYSCILPAEARITGNDITHISKQNFISSLEIKLLKGNINSITRFKLLLPETKNSDNEIFSSVLLNQLNFLTPKTFYVPVNFNGHKVKFLFQESVAKEFLESNQLREGPIIKGIIGFEFADRIKTHLVRQVNYKWPELGVNSLKISLKAVSSLNKIYLRNILDNHMGNNNIYSLNLNDYENGKINQKYEALLIALQSPQALELQNRTFYYDPMYKYFIPIYTNGFSKILGSSENTYRNLLNGRDSFSEGEINGAKIALIDTQKIDEEKMLNILMNYGVEISSKDFKQTIRTIKSHLKIIADSSSNFQEFSYKNYPLKTNDTKQNIVFLEKNFQLEQCNFSLTNCSYISSTKEDFSKLFRGKSSKSNPILMFLGDKDDYQDSYINNIQNSKFKVVNITNNSKLLSYGQIDVEMDFVNKILNLHQKGAEGRALIVGGELRNWKINFFGISEQSSKDKQRFDENLLTGCLTFLDMRIKKIDILVDKSICEDAVNLLRVSGDINKVLITNSDFDGLDIDFSDLNIDNLKIFYAGNDCLDLSSGNYKFQYSNLSNCLDKAISIGEKSLADFNSIIVTNSNIGVASKDSSIANIVNMISTDTTLCFSAYNKKQEFWGGSLFISQHNCDPNSYFEQENSRVEFMK